GANLLATVETGNLQFVRVAAQAVVAAPLGGIGNHRIPLSNTSRRQSTGLLAIAFSPSWRRNFGLPRKNRGVAPSSSARWNHLAFVRAGTSRTATSARDACSTNGPISDQGGLQNTRLPSHGIW